MVLDFQGLNINHYFALILTHQIQDPQPRFRDMAVFSRTCESFLHQSPLQNQSHIGVGWCGHWNLRYLLTVLRTARWSVPRLLEKEWLLIVRFLMPWTRLNMVLGPQPRRRHRRRMLIPSVLVQAVPSQVGRCL